MNKLVVIGWIGLNKCYLNVSEEQAIERYCKSENITIEDLLNNVPVETIEFEDEFSAYSVSQ